MATKTVSERRFRRELSDGLIRTLASNRFWKSLCADRQLQPEIRNRAITVYCYGRALLRELRLKNGELTATIHHKFIPLQKSNPSTYLSTTWRGGQGFQFDEQLQPQPLADGDSDVLKAYKRLMKFEAGPEDVLQQRIVAKAQNLILDQQIAFPAVGHNKLDICCYDPSIERLVFVEVKRIDDPRLLVPNERPEVIDQLQAYSTWLQREENSIVTAYKEVVRLKRTLGLTNRIKAVPAEDFQLETKPLLVIGNCTRGEVDALRRASKAAKGNNPWFSLWQHLKDVACGLILCGTGGCQLSLGSTDGQRWRF